MKLIGCVNADFFREKKKQVEGYFICALKKSFQNNCEEESCVEQKKCRTIYQNEPEIHIYTLSLVFKQ